MINILCVKQLIADKYSKKLLFAKTNHLTVQNVANGFAPNVLNLIKISTANNGKPN